MQENNTEQESSQNEALQKLATMEQKLQTILDKEKLQEEKEWRYQLLKVCSKINHNLEKFVAIMEGAAGVQNAQTE